MLKQSCPAHPLFFKLLDEFDLNQLEKDNGTIYGLWPDLTLAYMNPAWSRFAAEHGEHCGISEAWPLGRSVIEATSARLRPFYIGNFGRCLRERRPWEHVCQQTVGRVHRQFHMTVFPLGRSEGLLVVNSLQRQTSQAHLLVPPPEEDYRNEAGVISQCCHCRRVRRAGGELAWDWIPLWERQTPARTSHGVCAACSGFYYSKAHWDLQSVIKPFSTISTL